MCVFDKSLAEAAAVAATAAAAAAAVPVAAVRLIAAGLLRMLLGLITSSGLNTPCLDVELTIEDNERKDGRPWTGGSTDGRTDGATDGQADGRTDGRTDGWIGG